MTKIITNSSAPALKEACTSFRQARKIVALTGAGISVESGIDDFRSPGGLWTRFSPDEYATIDVFRDNPRKAWSLFRMLEASLQDKHANKAHTVLADFEKKGFLKGIITQNIDGLHQQAGSHHVLELHGDGTSLHCIACGYSCPLPEKQKKQVQADLPLCPCCNHPLKPNVVLFGEEVRSLTEALQLLHGCDLLLVVGTSAQVFPAADMPRQVKMSGGKIFEFNRETTVLSNRGNKKNGKETTISDILFQGRATEMLSLLAQNIAL